MCGIVGIWPGGTHPNLTETVHRMSKALLHRGPDADGIWTHRETGICLAHRRLSIIDLSDAGSQPMISESQRYVLTYNGEIYNHTDLRFQLQNEGHNVWNGTSDTETLLAAIEHWGLEKTVQQLDGMFAFAVWDNQENNLTLVRDKFGEKPLYYGHIENDFVFSSELKALEQHPYWEGYLEAHAVNAYFELGYVPAPLSIYKNIKKLPHATKLQVSSPRKDTPQPRLYWTTDSAKSSNEQRDIDTKSNVDTFDKLLRRTVKSRLIADVPVGALLSSGVDSTLIVSVMSSVSSNQVKTFTVGVDSDTQDESTQAEAIAHHLGTNHTTLKIDEAMAVNRFPKLFEIWDEPFSDPSALPTYLICQLTREHVSVVLSGDGGDELFGGYNRYNRGYRAWSRFSKIPYRIRKKVCDYYDRNPSSSIFRAFEASVNRIQPDVTSQQIHKFFQTIGSENEFSYYCNTITSGAEKYLNSEIQFSEKSICDFLKNSREFPDFRSTMMDLDLHHYLPDDILVKLDRASMAVGMEARPPYLSQDIFTFAQSLPVSEKISNSGNKLIMRELLKRYLPETLTHRSKIGFNFPFRDWLCGNLRCWVEELISEQRIREDGFLNYYLVQVTWERYLAGDEKFESDVLRIIAFQSWNTTRRSRLSKFG